ncbi:tetratricopeptide repeat protein [Streptomyces sp. SID8366]|uniref:AfsR/SARP family transcriptional regulator n=1 Tax=unclassified Streptomyces TaxID=2593676 RepID=UPI000DBA7685|nr:BTAD domain-containing putative transcriptional regulator [Streptomyces sp. PsTaAH-130]MYU03627.1 tetratricopeptide repeat protein [Streptomyces sp. SID8366]MYU64077.1 tetratricopeptide repeat protein [Streptomyces sp. SID69]RAJ57688.1 DNA-binding SARP family transcriptional activator [Streptomyces sp. PsTaAH-130]
MAIHRFSVLGPLGVHRGADVLAAGPPQQQAMLAVLLLSRNKTATACDLLDALWGDRPPGRPMNTIRTYAWRWRKLLEPDPACPSVLVARGDGYELAVPDDHVDALVAERLIADAERALRRGEPDTARTLLRRAQDLWRGEPLLGVPGPFAERQRQRLRGVWLDLLEQRITLDLRGGRTEQCVRDLTELVAADPLRERSHALLMEALHREGKRADALAAFRHARTVLVDELGVEPGPELAALHQSILTGAPPEPAVRERGRSDDDHDRDHDEDKAPTGSRPMSPPPAQLPPALPDFTGREELLAGLVGALTEQDRSAPAVVAVSGMGGVGKTSLAVQTAHRVRHAYPDGQLYADLRGNAGRPVAAETVLADFLIALGTDPGSLPEALAARSALFRSAVDGRRLLLVLDDAHDAAQVRPLLPGTPGCAVVITSRTRLSSLPACFQRDLDVLTPIEALRMLARTTDRRRVDAEPVAAREVLDACGYLPLAVRIVAARLAARPGWSIGTLGERLRAEHRRIDELRTGDLAVRATFELGYRQLTPDQATAFRQAALLAGPLVAVSTAAAVLGVPEPDAEDLLESLVDLAVLQTPRPGRYRFHDLLRLFARQKSRTRHPAETVSVPRRQLDFLLATAREAFRWAVPDDPVGEALAQTDTAGMAFADFKSAQRWAVEESEAALTLAGRIADGILGSGHPADRPTGIPGHSHPVERPTGIPGHSRPVERPDGIPGPGRPVDRPDGAADPAAAPGADEGPALRRAVDLLIALSPFGPDPRLGEGPPTVRRLAEAAVRLQDRRTEGRARFLLGTYHLAAGEPVRAEAQARAAAEACRESDDLVVLRQAANDLGLITSYLGRPGEAVGHYDEAIALARALGHRSGELVTTVNAALARARSGQAAEAVAACESVLRGLRSRPDDVVRAFTHYVLGLALHALRRYEEAVTAFTDCLTVSRDAGLRSHGAQARFRMADSLRALGRQRPALEHARESLAALEEAGAARDIAQCLVVLGRIWTDLGDFTAARGCLERARESSLRLGLPDIEEIAALLDAVPAA